MEANTAADWRTFVRRHWEAVTVFGVAAALALAWSGYVFLWFSSNAQSSGLVPSILRDWTLGNAIAFAVYLVLWELLLVGIPAVAVVVAAWLWWKRIPEDEKRGYHLAMRSRSAGGGALSFFFFVGFCIKVYVDGNWNVPISSFTLNYVVSSMFAVLLWSLIILGVPAAAALAWWLNREMKRP